MIGHYWQWLIVIDCDWSWLVMGDDSWWRGSWWCCWWWRSWWYYCWWLPHHHDVGGAALINPLMDVLVHTAMVDHVAWCFEECLYNGSWCLIMSTMMIGNSLAGRSHYSRGLAKEWESTDTVCYCQLFKAVGDVPPQKYWKTIPFLRKDGFVWSICRATSTISARNPPSFRGIANGTNTNSQLNQLKQPTNRS